MDQSLLVFITVVEKQNFTRAAEALHMTQPAVSQYVQTLERNIGAKLLERSSKTVQLTKAGEIVYHHALEMLALHTKMRHLVDDLMNQASGKLAIGASYTFGEYVLPHVVAYLKARFPLVVPKITIANTKRIGEWVATRQLDLGIVDGHVASSALRAEEFADDLLYLVAAARHPLSQKSVVTAADLQRETWIVREEASGTRKATEKVFADLRFYPDNIMEFGSTQLIKESVLAGLGVTLLSHCTIQKEVSLGMLELVAAPGSPFQRKFSLITPDTRFKTKATSVLIDILRQHDGLPPFFGQTIPFPSAP